LNIKCRQRIAGGNELIDAWAAGKELCERPLAFKDYCGCGGLFFYNRGVTNELNCVAEALFSMQQDGAVL
jgi:hypothetical protein